MIRRSLAAALLVLGARLLVSQSAPARSPRNTAEFDELFQRVSNWGRWGKEDQLGSLNLVTPAKRKEAIRLAKEGLTVSLAHSPLTEEAEDNPSPFEYSKNPTISRPFQVSLVDTYKVSYHGYAHSHLDALCHILWKDRAWNGYPRAEVETPSGCAKLSVDNLKNGILTRGVLIDIPRLRDLPYLEPGTPIYAEDLEAWEKMSGVRIESGDAIFLRTGRWARREKLGPWNVADSSAGLHASAVPWIKARGVAVAGSDDAFDVHPTLVEGVALPVHILMITALGIHLLDNMDLESLADTAAKLKRWDFMLTVAPIPVTGGSGSPVNALATF